MKMCYEYECVCTVFVYVCASWRMTDSWVRKGKGHVAPGTSYRRK
jgi:hypothetical protein